MSDAFIYSAVRTPVGRHGGALAGVRPDDLAALVVGEAARRAGCDPSRVDDIILGCVNQAGEDNRNVARMAALLAGFPVTVPGQTVNRLCGSGLQAAVSASHAIRAGEGGCFIAGGVESMTRAPFVMLKSGTPWNRTPPPIADSALGWRFVNPLMPARHTASMGETAENVAQRWGITREEQDAFALESQARAAKAIESGAFDAEIVAVEIPGKGGATTRVTRDEHPRADTTREGLAKLAPAFRKEGTVTAGNSSGVNDGAAALLIGAGGAIPGARPLARIVASAVAGVEPDTMGIGPVPATRLALQRAGLRVSDLDLVELNEAFAAQAIACIRELDLSPERVNPYGGAIALGHPLGCTGARLLVTLAQALIRTGGRYGLVTMCIGVGQGIATIIENAGAR